jgi:hypothetical protein
MKQKTKQELRDRIAYLEGVDRVNYNLREELHTQYRHIKWLETRGARATIAAYALAAYATALTIWVVVL